METQKKDVKQKTNIPKVLGTMFKWMGKYWPLLIVAFVILYIVSYVRTLLPLIGQHIFDVTLNFSDGGTKLPAFLAKYLLADTDRKSVV